jgi:hypothetical protein
VDNTTLSARPAAAQLATVVVVDEHLTFADLPPIPPSAFDPPTRKFTRTLSGDHQLSAKADNGIRKITNNTIKDFTEFFINTPIEVFLIKKEEVKLNI